MKGKRRFIFRLGVTLVISILLARSTDWGAGAFRLADIEWGFVLLACAIALLDRLLMAYKWGVLLEAKGIRLSLWTLLKIYWASSFVGLVLPATVGGDALRAYAVARRGHAIADVVASIVVERILGITALLTYLLLGVAAALAVFNIALSAEVLRLVGAVSAGVAALGAVLLWLLAGGLRGGLDRRLAWLTRTRAGGVANRLIAKIGASLGSYGRPRRPLIAFFFLSIVENLLPIAWTISLALALKLTVPPIYFVLLVPVVLVLVRLPISLDGFGIQEGAFVYFLWFIGVGAADALLLGLASHVVALLSILPGGLIVLSEGLLAGGDAWPDHSGVEKATG
jgi:uncharacterized protein (TIRG00374 family)